MVESAQADMRGYLIFFFCQNQITWLHALKGVREEENQRKRWEEEENNNDNDVGNR